MVEKTAAANERFPLKDVSLEDAQNRLTELLPVARQQQADMLARHKTLSLHQRRYQDAQNAYRGTCSEIDQLTLYLRSGQATYPSGRDSR